MDNSEDTRVDLSVIPNPGTPTRYKNGMEFRAAAITMAYNEDVNVSIWCKHYGNHLGFENIYVIDHGSTDNSVDSNVCNRIRIPRSEFDDVVRAEMVSHLHRSLLQYFDVVIYTDCDEFIIPRPSKFSSMIEFLKTRTEETTRVVGINVVQQSLDLLPLDPSRPILRQRPFGSASHWVSKPLISSVPISWEAGFHDCTQTATLNLDAWMFHLKFSDVEHGLRKLSRTRSLAWSERALQSNFGNHHRMSDVEYMNLFGWLHTNLMNENIDTFDLSLLFDNRLASPIGRIPEEFLDLL